MSDASDNFEYQPEPVQRDEEQWDYQPSPNVSMPSMEDADADRETGPTSADSRFEYSTPDATREPAASPAMSLNTAGDLLASLGFDQQTVGPVASPLDKARERMDAAERAMQGDQSQLSPAERMGLAIERNKAQDEYNRQVMKPENRPVEKPDRAFQEMMRPLRSAYSFLNAAVPIPENWKMALTGLSPDEQSMVREGLAAGAPRTVTEKVIDGLFSGAGMAMGMAPGNVAAGKVVQATGLAKALPNIAKLAEGGLGFMLYGQAEAPTEMSIRERLNQAGWDTALGAAFAANGMLARLNKTGAALSYPIIAGIGAATAGEAATPEDRWVSAITLMMLHGISQGMSLEEAQRRAADEIRPVKGHESDAMVRAVMERTRATMAGESLSGSDHRAIPSGSPEGGAWVRGTEEPGSTTTGEIEPAQQKQIIETAREAMNKEDQSDAANPRADTIVARNEKTMHSASERVAGSREMAGHKVEERPGSFYTQLPTEIHADAQKAMTDNELSANFKAVQGRIAPEVGEDFGAMDGAELLNRFHSRFREKQREAEDLESRARTEQNPDRRDQLMAQVGAMRGEAQEWNTKFGAQLDEMNQLGMNAGRIIQQFRYLKTKVPGAQLAFIETALKKRGLGLLPEQRTRLQRAIDQDNSAQDGLRQATRAWMQHPSEETAGARDRAAKAAQRAAQVYSDALRVRGKTNMFVTMMQMGVLDSLSLAGNTLGNLIFAPVRVGSDAVAAAADRVVSMVSGRQRQLASGGIGAALRGAWEARKPIAQAILHGENPSLASGGERSADVFKPARALVELWSGENIPRVLTDRGLTRRSLRAQGERIIEGTIGWYTAAMERGLLAGDIPFFEAAKAQELYRLGKLKGLIGATLDQFMRNPDPASAARAEAMGKEAVFQQDSWLARGAVSLASAGAHSKTPGLKLLNAVVVRPLILFAKTPANIAIEAGQYFIPPISGPLGIAQAIAGKRSGNNGLYQNGMRMAARAVIGTAMLGVAQALNNWGVLFPRPNDAKRKDAMDATTGTNRFNWSGFRRRVDAMLAGEQDEAKLKSLATWRDGDDTYSFNYLGLPGMAMNIMANGRDGYLKKLHSESPYTRADASFAASLVAATLKATADLPMLKGMDNLMAALYRGAWDSPARQWASTIGSAVIPRGGKTLNEIQASWLADPSAQGLGEQAVNELWKSRVWGLYETMPLRYDYFGRPIPTVPEGFNPWVVKMIDARRPGKVRADPVDRYVADCYDRTGDLRFIPGIPEKDRWFRWPVEGSDGVQRQGIVEMDPVQYAQLVKLTGEYRRKALSAMLQTPGFSSNPLPLQAREVDRMYDAALLAAKKHLLQTGQLRLKFVDEATDNSR